MNSDAQQRANARKFIVEWTGKGDEVKDSHKFWEDLIFNVLGIPRSNSFMNYEKNVRINNNTKHIDIYIPTTKVLIENKGKDKDLGKEEKQSDGEMLTPLMQGIRYAQHLPYSEQPRWVIACNFKEFQILDRNKVKDNIITILLENLEEEIYRFRFLYDEGTDYVPQEERVSIQAGELVGKLYDGLLKQYEDPTSPETLHSLNVLCVRLVFCLYAEDAGLLKGTHNAFYLYLRDCPAEDIRQYLIDLFRVLNTPKDKRKYIKDSLKDFPYVAGGLFEDENIEIPLFTESLKNILLQRASDEFNWREISPTIFGAVFESTLNPETRRNGGMHYTSIANIHKVIDPLFLDSLKQELAELKDFVGSNRTKERKLLQFQDKLASMNFLDPACGSGNFLTETYLSLRKLENEVLKTLNCGQIQIGGDEFGDPIKVKIGQFYGLEINDFAITVAKTALWIAESQMFDETQTIIQDSTKEFFPLVDYKQNMYHGNALSLDWNELIASSQLNYIIGNPPFVGARLMSETQKSDVISVFGKEWKNVGNLDYVCCWYKKCADYINGTNIRCALVSTNSVSQGEQVANLWKPLISNQNIHIDYAWRTFRWDSEASIKAHVHCVIIGFSQLQNDCDKYIFDVSKEPIKAKNINPYLIDAPSDIFIDSRPSPICNVPEIGIGNKPIDDGNYLFTEEEMCRFIAEEPKAKQYFLPFYGAQEFINQKPRYCLWLGDCKPSELVKMPLCLERIRKVKEFRLSSKSAGTRKLAEKPTRFHVENMPKDSYLLIPRVSSEKREYIPIGYLSSGMLCSDSVHITTESSIFHFGILTSSVHMAWMRAVCGRLEMRYRYSKDIVYNNFPWPNVTDKQKGRIEQTALAILNARESEDCKGCSYAELYGENMDLFSELYNAHKENDKAVLDAYGFSPDMTESEIVAELMRLHKKIVDRG